jgi:hypothetical protein
MGDYQLKPNGFVLKRDGNFLFDSNSWLWGGYALWISKGNTPDPIYSIDELKALTKDSLLREKNRRLDLVNGDDREKRRRLMAGIILSRKEYKNSLEDGDNEHIAEIEKIAAYNSALDEFVSGQNVLIDSGDIEYLENYNPGALIGWPIFGG